jgi:hypothetical protein
MDFHLFELTRFAARLRPFSFTRPLALIRLGLFTAKERWEIFLSQEVSVSGSGLTAELWPRIEGPAIFVDAAWIPTEVHATLVKNLQPGEALFCEDRLLACHSLSALPEMPVQDDFLSVEYLPDALLLNRPWDIFSLNGRCIRTDFSLITKGRLSMDITDPFTRVYNPEEVFVEEGADVKASIINASEGPVYIGKGVQIQEGSLIRGPVALMENSVVNMG